MDATTQRAVDQRYERFVAGVADKTVSVPTWASPTQAGKKLVVPTAFLSDTHFDEVVDPAQVNNVNAYSRAIAEKRLKAFFARTVKLGKQYLAGLSFPGIVLPLGGDLFSGNIHEELRQTNEASLAESLLHWIGPMVAGIRLLADEYGKVYVPAVVGNHPRGTPKPIHKGRVRDNFDWLFYQLLARELKGDKRVTFAISEAPDFHYSVFQTKYCLTHGDQFRGGSGISGLLSPMMIGDARKRKRSQAVNLPYDYLVMGHWHQLTQAKSVIVNGSLKGYDEYAFNSNFDYEPPQQAFWLTSIERRQTWCFTPIHVTDRDDPYSGANQDTLQFAPAFKAA
ncbi:MAG: hypothetical protein IT168_33335 [Bryobacterales bacterium]|nr:hypothetical protein [Bryobacterales bacterium]